ncbi:MAG: hypothetical protein IT440_00480 [Phycisphaeraceae bacterium]|nr:hypothetical protein [Phycisphaeraceae bacterium]
MRIVSRMTMIGILVAACCGLALGETPAATQPATGTTRRPAALFIHGCDHDFAGKLVRDGWEVNSREKDMDASPLTWDEVKTCNVLVLTGLGLANADGTLDAKMQQNIAMIRQFLDAGGGVLFVPTWGQIASQVPPQAELLKPMGLIPRFEEVVYDRKSPVNATSWGIPFSCIEQVESSPITRNVRRLWVPIANRAGGEAHTVPLSVDDTWKVVASGSLTTYTITVPLTQFSPSPQMTKGLFDASVPLVAMKEMGKGRMVACGINAAYLWGRWAGLTLEGVTLDRGLLGKPSDGYPLVRDSLRWLAEPSEKAGNLGGAKTSPRQLENPAVVKFSKPFDWTGYTQASFPRAGRQWRGVVGVQSAFSGGKGTIEQWVAQARSVGLDYLVFLEDFAKLPPDHFAQLVAECARLTTADFAAIPGFRILDEIGNHYLYAGANLPYPSKELLSDDGKVFVSYDPGVSPKDPRAIRGQLDATTSTYTYTLGGFKMTAGHYLFRRGAAPVANWFSGYTSVGVITREAGKVVEDATPEYLQLVAAGQAPLPLAVDLLDDPAQLAQTPWRTVMNMKTGDHTVSGMLDGANPVASYLSHWNFYPDNPTRIHITEGPMIDYWSMNASRDYEASSRGDFVWQNYRWRVGGKVRSETGLKDVAIYDGTRLFRRFQPDGAKEFEFAMDLTHDRQHNLVLIVTDTAGRRAISSEQWDRNHRLQETSCSDRHNQLTGGFTARSQDDTLVLVGGNHGLVTPHKRIIFRSLWGGGPQGAFDLDAFLGAPAFDGATTGGPEVVTPVNLLTRDNRWIAGPIVGEGRRVMCSGDVNIGEGLCNLRFTDNVPTYNLFHTLWKTEPSKDIAVDQRNHFFQLDPDSPLAVYLWKLRLTWQDDMEAAKVVVGSIHNNRASLWAVRGSDGATLSGNNEDTAMSTPRQQSLPFGFGAYAAALDSPLGGCAVFPLTDGMAVNWNTPQTREIQFVLPGETCPRKKGESRDVDLLLVGIPRSTKYTRMFPPRTTQVIEQFRREFGLGEAGPAYKLTLTAGKVVSQRYILRINGAESQAFSGIIEGKLMSTLPIVVEGLHDRWSAFLYDRQLKAARPLGIVENQAWATVPMRGKTDLFVGHPVTCDNPDIFLQLVQTGDNNWQLEVNNPTDATQTVTWTINPHFDPLRNRTPSSQTIIMNAGKSVVLNW